MSRFVCIHGHFYQPPRENPWLEEVEYQESAYPFHDWNQKVTAECYAPNTAARILDERHRIVSIVNIYSRISFNFGPTLLSWLERKRPKVYAAILEADRVSLQRYSGHGAALAQAYNHMILPLASRHDKRTQVLWGLRDFEKRFGRSPEGMWLPETAVDTESLEALAEQNITFTLLAPHQAGAFRPLSGGAWENPEGGIDTTRPYLCRLPSGRSIVLFFYDGAIAQDLAFGRLLENGGAFARRLEAAFPKEETVDHLVHVATDGETYGHHHKYGEMALAWCLNSIEEGENCRLTVYGEYLEAHPPAEEVRIVERSSWSCIHGVERWRDDCGCSSGENQRWHQRWRGPLREAMDWLREHLEVLYEKGASSLVNDVWGARDDYIRVILDRTRGCRSDFLHRNASGRLSREQVIRLMKLLEMERNAMLMYTSCGWFFNDISGIETRQILCYACRAIQLAETLEERSLEEGFRAILRRAPSNVREFGNGALLYDRLVRSCRLDLLDAAAHFALLSLFERRIEDIEMYSYTVRVRHFDFLEAGGYRLSIGHMELFSGITLESREVGGAMLCLGGHNVVGGISENFTRRNYVAMKRKLEESFDRGDISGMIEAIDVHMGHHEYDLRYLFRDEQRRVMSEIVRKDIESMVDFLRDRLADDYLAMNFMVDIGMPLPNMLLGAAKITLNSEISGELEKDVPDLEFLERRLRSARRWKIELDEAAFELKAGRQVKKLMEVLEVSPDELPLMESIRELLRFLGRMKYDVDLWPSQNIYFRMMREIYPEKRVLAEEGDERASCWIKIFEKIGRQIGICLPINLF